LLSSWADNPAIELNQSTGQWETQQTHPNAAAEWISRSPRIANPKDQFRVVTKSGQLWLAHSDDETRGRQFNATIAALIEIGPKDEIEGMIATQLIATHNATMECYRRAMIGDQTLEGRRENLNQANKLSRTYATLIEALNRHRGKGQQKVTVEHVHVHAGGQAVVGVVESPGG
jgi:hypothetical protein